MSTIGSRRTQRGLPAMGSQRRLWQRWRAMAHRHWHRYTGVYCTPQHAV